MRYATRITIGTRTEEFYSSEETLGTNLFATLLIRGRGIEICDRLAAVLASSDTRNLRFQEEDVLIEANEIPFTENISSANSSAA